jgi:hypothetical protein
MSQGYLVTYYPSNSNNPDPKSSQLFILKEKESCFTPITRGPPIKAKDIQSAKDAFSKIFPKRTIDDAYLAYETGGVYKKKSMFTNGDTIIIKYTEPSDADTLKAYKDHERVCNEDVQVMTKNYRGGRKSRRGGRKYKNKKSKRRRNSRTKRLR